MDAQVFRMIAAITGANGFIGSHLSRTFAQRGWEVRKVVRADFERGELDRLLSATDVVIHAAGATRAPTVRGLEASNVDLTRAVMHAAERANVSRVVYVSSQAAAGPAPYRDKPIDETSPPAPIDAYGRTKLAAERVVREFARVQSVIVRPAAVYGPGDRDFKVGFDLARQGIAIHAGNRAQWISIVHVDDLVDGIERAATNPNAVGQTFFFANDDPIQWGALFERAARAAGRSLLADVEVPRPLVSLGAAFGDVAARVTGYASLLTSEKVRLSHPAFWICSSERAKRELGWLPRVSLEAGLRALMSS